jgi:uncharacterized protein YkwD
MSPRGHPLQAARVTRIALATLVSSDVVALYRWCVLAAVCGFTASPLAHADAFSAVQVLREGGCGGLMPSAQPLRRDVGLDQAAQQWAVGSSLPAAVQAHGFRPEFTTGLRLEVPEAALLETLRAGDCRLLTDRTLRAAGLYRSGAKSWLVLAYADLPPGTPRTVASPTARSARSGAEGTAYPAGEQQLAARALQLVNDVRARGVRCGARAFAPAPPVALSGALADVALGHAADMARNSYFEHTDLSGRTAADRVRAAGYRERLVGENSAYGPRSVDEVVRGWLDSPGHCENIMDPRFAEMGIASATGQQAERQGPYWVQVLAEPRS